MINLVWLRWSGFKIQAPKQYPKSPLKRWGDWLEEVYKQLQFLTLSPSPHLDDLSHLPFFLLYLVFLLQYVTFSKSILLETNKLLLTIYRSIVSHAHEKNKTYCFWAIGFPELRRRSIFIRRFCMGQQTPSWRTRP